VVSSALSVITAPTALQVSDRKRLAFPHLANPESATPRVATYGFPGGARIAIWRETGTRAAATPSS
jgi:hypothetical protein